MSNDLRGMEELLDADRASFEESAPDLSALFAQVAAETVDRAPTLRDRLREQSTTVRAALATSAVGVFGLAFLLTMGLRQDITGSTLTNLLVTMGTLVVVALIAMRFSLRALDERPLGLTSWALGAGLLLLPLALAWAPWHGMHVPHEMAVMAGTKCFMAGTMFSAWTAGVVVLLDRGDTISFWRFAMAAGAGGIVGFAFTGLHCPAVDLSHMLFGHGFSGMIVAGAVLALRFLRGR